MDAATAQEIIKESNDTAKAMQEAFNAAKLQEIAQTGLRTAGIAAAGGAALRGLFGLGDLIGGGPAKPTQAGPVVLNIPYPARAKTPTFEEDALRRVRHKAAEGEWDWLRVFNPKEWYRAATGEGAQNIIQHPLGLPAIVGGGMLGVYGGWRGADALLESAKKQKQKSELEAARSDFQQALMSEYRTPRHTALPIPFKQAELGDTLDEIYEKSKEGQFKAPDAGWGFNPESILGTGAGVTLTAEGLVSALAAGMGYQHAVKRTDADILERARKQRLQAIQQSRPADIYLQPVPFAKPEPLKLDEG